MKCLHVKLIVLLIVACLISGSCSSFSAKAAARKAERQMAGPHRSGNNVRESRKVRLAKKGQERNQAKLKKEYRKHVSRSRKRSYEIQSPDVKERMKQNESQLTQREKEKKKKTRADSKNRAERFR